MFENEPVESKPMSLRHKIVVAVVDVCILVEVFVAMYQAGHAPDNFTPTFVKTFFPMLAVTLLSGYVLARLCRPKQPLE